MNKEIAFWYRKGVIREFEGLHIEEIKNHADYYDIIVDKDKENIFEELSKKGWIKVRIYKDDFIVIICNNVNFQSEEIQNVINFISDNYTDKTDNVMIWDYKHKEYIKGKINENTKIN